MLANRKRKRPAETWGNATSPNWTFARHDGKNGAVFPSFFFASTLPCSSLRTLNCIYELSDTFSDNKSSVEISRPLFLTSTTINIWIRCRFFKKLLVLVRGCTGAGLSCCAFFSEFPRAPKERIQCVLHFTLRELLGVTRFWWSLLPLTTNTGPVPGK